MVILKAGPKKTPFQIHKGLLCKASPYFRAALEGGFNEAKAQIIDWPEEDPSIVKIFQLWLYSGSVSTDPKTNIDSWAKLVDLYIFAEAHDLPVLNDAVIDALIAMTEQSALVNVCVFNKVYSMTTPKAPLKRLLVDLAVHHWDLKEKFLKEGSLKESYLKHFPKEYLVEIVLAQCDCSKKKKWTIKDFSAARDQYLHVQVARRASGDGKRPRSVLRYDSYQNIDADQ